MKKTIQILFVFLYALSINAQEPVIKIYMNDGSAKQYKINDIADLSFIRTNLSYSMIVFQSKLNSKSDFDIRTIDSIKFENNQTMNIIQSDNTKSLIIAEIDSIYFVLNTCTKQIGSQIWMCKNLDVNTYRNGDLIPEVQDSAQWANLTTGAWCYYNNSDSLGKIYGKIYNWYAVNDPRGLAPNGWRVPSDNDWKTLEIELGLTQQQADSTDWRGTNEGGKLKEETINYWGSPNVGATNQTGYTALPSGSREDTAQFYNFPLLGYWWSSTSYNINSSWIRYLCSYYSQIGRGLLDNDFGIAVRCVKDK